MTERERLVVRALGSEASAVALQRMLGGADASYDLVVDCMRELGMREDQLEEPASRVALGDLMVQRGGAISVIGRTLRLRAKVRRLDDSS